ncbi:MAG: hypothetical protein Ct9H90mP7_5210 [Candidatus Neomarinimicrobiota bacterium]|nr:MAG: hypothetical protein Ct9H90mP7_5210 [Candidatus Neomarinimicrobiota bacterium]
MECTELKEYRKKPTKLVKIFIIDNKLLKLIVKNI